MILFYRHVCRNICPNIWLSIALILLASCTSIKTQEPGIGEAIGWHQVDGWDEDTHDEAWPALKQSCTKLAKKPAWGTICETAKNLPSPDSEQAREFFETWFEPHRIFGADGEAEGLITGYYEPLLQGSFTRSERYRFPLHRRPDSLLKIDLGSRYPDLKKARLRGRLVNNKVIPFYSRGEITADETLLAGDELLWVDDRDAAFFLHVQGSGRVQLPDSKIIGVGYADQNGHVYKSIGKVLVDREELALKDVSLFTIRQWLDDNPDQAVELLNQNPSYVFFVLRETVDEGPIGSLNVPLTPVRSLAIDPKVVELGSPIWLSTHHPGAPDEPLRRLVFAQDTGGAIKGLLRADLFWGNGIEAERAAGTMKSVGSLIILLPKKP